MKKFLRVLGNILIVLFLIVALAVMTSVLTSKKGDGLPNLYGYSPLSVQSDSMEPSIKKGDLILIEQRDDYNNLKVNDVVTYYAFLDGQKYYDTHKIIKIEPHNEYNYYVTKGDNAPAEDTERASFANIVGVYTGRKIPYIGAAMDFLKTQMGIFLLVVLPLALLFIWQLFKFMSILMDTKRQAVVEEMSADIEGEKEKAIEEYKAQQEAAKKAQAAAALTAADIELEKQKAIEEYKAQQEAAKKAQAAAALTAADIELEKQKAIEEYKAQQEAAKKAEAAATLSAADIEREKQKAVEEYIAQQKAAEDATVGNDPCVVPEQTEEPAESAESTESAESAEPAEPATVGNDPCVVPEQTEEPTESTEPATVGNDPCVVPEQTEEPAESAEPTESTEPAEPATVGNDPRVVPENVEKAPVAEADSSVPVKEAAREADEVKEQESSDCRDEHCSHEPHEDDENTNENTGEDTNN